MYELTKALLYAYPMLGELSEAIGCSIENRAVLSFRSCRTALEDAQDIAGDLARRCILEELAFATECVFGLLSEEDNMLLEYKYLRRKHVWAAKYEGKRLPYSERNYYRRQNELIEKICRMYAALGWTEERLESVFCDLPLLPRIVSAIRRGKERCVPQKRNRGRIAVQNSCSLSCGEGRFPRRTNTAMATATAHTRQMATIAPAPSPVSSGGASSVEVFTR